MDKKMNSSGTERDDLLGKNKTRNANSDANDDPFDSKKAYRKRTEDLGDSL
jgi:hypothetical protein